MALSWTFSSTWLMVHRPIPCSKSTRLTVSVVVLIDWCHWLIDIESLAAPFLCCDSIIHNFNWWGRELFFSSRLRSYRGCRLVDLSCRILTLTLTRHIVESISGGQPQGEQFGAELNLGSELRVTVRVRVAINIIASEPGRIQDSRIRLRLTLRFKHRQCKVCTLRSWISIASAMELTCVPMTRHFAWSSSQICSSAIAVSEIWFTVYISEI